MDVGGILCLGILAAQLGMQIREVFSASRTPPTQADPATTARRAFLDRKADIERDARRRM